MALKDLLIAYDDTPAARAALAFALGLARRHDAVLTGAYVYTPAARGQTVRQWLREDVIATMERAERDAAEAIGDAFQSHVAAALPPGCGQRQIEWIATGGEPGPTLARIGRFHDLMVIGQFVRSIARESGALEPEELIQRAGRPVIVVPVGPEVAASRLGGAADNTNAPAETPNGDRALIVLAWDGSRASARALSDVIQVLSAPARIDVVTVETGRQRDLYAPLPERDLIVHLSRHGIEARIVNVEAPADRVGHAILDHCAVVQPDLLAMGAYGRAKFGTLRFGGVTQHVIENMTVPLLLSR